MLSFIKKMFNSLHLFDTKLAVYFYQRFAVLFLKSPLFAFERLLIEL